MPASIALDRPDVPRDLVEICVKMMQKSPQSRYPHSRDVAAALRAWLDGRPQPLPGLGDSGGFGTALPSPPTGGKLPQPGGGGPGSGRRREAVTTYSLEDLLAPEDTVSNLDRATMKGPAKAGGPKAEPPGSNVRTGSAAESPSGKAKAPPGSSPRGTGSGKQQGSGKQPNKAAKPGSPEPVPTKDPLLNTFESLVDEELASINPLSQQSYNPKKPVRKRRAMPDLPWVPIAVVVGFLALVILIYSAWKSLTGGSSHFGEPIVLPASTDQR
jgi:hypothetical protein